MTRQGFLPQGSALLWIGYAALLLPFAVSPAPGWLPDASIYLLMAEALSPWHGPASPAARFALEHSSFPPLFPLLVGLAGGGLDASVARALSAACVCASLALLHALLRARGFGAPAALLGASAFALLPGTLLQSLEGMSEPLYLLLSLATLTAAARAGSSDAGWRRHFFAAALFAGLALATRSAGIALVLALGVWWISRRVPARQLPWLLIAALGPSALWSGAKAWLGFPGSYAPALESRLASYAPETSTAFARAIPEQLAALLRAWPELFALHPGLPARVAAAALGLLALLGIARGLARRDLAALYAALYLAMIALWPFPAHAARFLWPLAPILLLLAAEAASALIARRAGPLMLALPLALALPSLATFATRFRAAQGFEAAAFTHTPRWYLADEAGARGDAVGRAALARAMQSVARVVPPHACVYSVSPEELMAWSRRIAKPPPPPSVPDAVFAGATHDCDWFFLAPLRVFPYETPYYPRERLGEGFELVALPQVDPGTGVLAHRLPAARAPSNARTPP